MHVSLWQIEAQGRQRRQMCQVDERGFIRSKPKERSRVRGFRTGDLVRFPPGLRSRASALENGEEFAGSLPKPAPGRGCTRGGRRFLPTAEAGGFRARPW